MEFWDDEEGSEREQLLADAGGWIRSLCETLSWAVDETDTGVVDENLPQLRPVVAEWLNTLSDLVPEPLQRIDDRSERDPGSPNAGTAIDVSEFFPTPLEIDEPDEYLRMQEIEDERSDLATRRVALADRELINAIRDLEDCSRETPSDSFPVSVLALRSERLVRLIDRWHKVWMLCLHGYYEVHGRYPGVAGIAVEVFEGWLSEMRFDSELRRLLEEGDR